MEIRIATAQEIEQVSKLSLHLGNGALSDRAVVSIMLRPAEKGKEIIGFAAVEPAFHAAGSWVEEKHRKQGHSYQLRACLDNELRSRGLTIYFALPANDFERHLFSKYGPVTETIAQVRHL